MEAGSRPKVMQGFTEAANVEPVREMVQMIEVNRAY
jgi:flagellar basal-body rod protein FlgG